MKERDYKLDLIRLVSIFLVVVIHYGNYYNRNLTDCSSFQFTIAAVYNGIARVCVPLFFMISGALMLGREITLKKLGKRVVHFVVLLVFWTAVYLCIDIFYYGINYTVSNYANLIFNCLKGHLWFMYAIIALYLILPFASLLAKNATTTMKKYFFILWLVFCGGVRILQIAFMLTGLTFTIKYPVPLVQGTYYLGFFLAGYWLREAVKNGYRISRVLCAIVYLLSTAASITGTCIYSVLQGDYFEEFYNYREIFILIASLAAFLFIIQGKEITNERIRKQLAFLAPNLFGVYLIHVIPFEFINYKVHTISYHPVWAIPCFSLLVFIISFVCVWIIRKIPVVGQLVE